MSTPEAFLVGGSRTPVGRYGGALSSVRPDDLAIQLGSLSPTMIGARYVRLWRIG